MKKRKQTILICALLAAVLVFIWFAGAVATPKRYENGANWGAFRKEERNSLDAVVFGSSRVYCNLIPEVMDDRSGLNWYVMGGPEQRTDVTYYYVREMFRTQNPRFILVEASNVFYGAEDGLGSSKVNVCYMPLGAARIEATLNAVPKKDRMGLFFPLYAYHDRWKELTADDWRIGLFGYKRDPLKGYTYLDDIVPLPDGPQEFKITQSEEAYEYNLQWLRKIGELCEKKGCRCYYYVSANYAYFNDESVAKLEADLNGYGTGFLNCMEDLDSIGFDPMTDFKDRIHLNHSGAEKHSRYMADKLLQLTQEY